MEPVFLGVRLWIGLLEAVQEEKSFPRLQQVRCCWLEVVLALRFLGLHLVCPLNYSGGGQEKQTPDLSAKCVSTRETGVGGFPKDCLVLSIQNDVFHSCSI